MAILASVSPDVLEMYRNDSLSIEWESIAVVYFDDPHGTQWTLCSSLTTQLFPYFRGHKCIQGTMSQFPGLLFFPTNCTCPQWMDNSVDHVIAALEGHRCQHFCHWLDLLAHLWLFLPRKVHVLGILGSLHLIMQPLEGNEDQFAISLLMIMKDYLELITDDLGFSFVPTFIIRKYPGWLERSASRD